MVVVAVYGRCVRMRALNHCPSLGLRLCSYTVLMLLNVKSERLGLLLLLAVLMVARILDVLVMTHSCFDVCSNIWWSLVYPVGILFVLREDSKFWELGRVLRRAHADSTSGGRRRASETPMATLVATRSRRTLVRIVRPRGDTITESNPVE